MSDDGHDHMSEATCKYCGYEKASVECVNPPTRHEAIHADTTTLRAEVVFLRERVEVHRKRASDLWRGVTRLRAERDEARADRDALVAAQEDPPLSRGYISLDRTLREAAVAWLVEHEEYHPCQGTGIPDCPACDFKAAHPGLFKRARPDVQAGPSPDSP